MSNLDLMSVIKYSNHYLGDNYEYLGKRDFFSKIMLSYTNERGWGICELNLFQLFLRSVFGAYSSTQLSHIVSSLDAISIPAPLDDRIKEIWNATYPDKPRPKFWGSFRNQETEPQLVCLTEYHIHPLNRKAIGKYLDKHRKEGDVVLVEGLDINNEKNAKDYDLTTEVTKNFTVLGCDAENVSELVAQIFGEGHTKWTALSDSSVQLYDAKTKPEIDIALEKFLNCLEDLTRYSIEDESRQNSKIKEFRKEIKEAYTDVELIGIQRVLKVCDNHLQALLDEYNRTRYKKIVEDKVASAKIEETYVQRSCTMRQEAKKHLKLGKKVFILTGFAHMLKFKYAVPFDDSYVKKVHKSFNKYSFEVLIASNLIEPGEVVQMNPNLRRVS